MPTQPRLTALRALGLGDLLTAVPALRALARAFPEHRRLLLAPRWLEPLLPLIVEEGEQCFALAECDGLEADPGALPGWPEVAVNLHGRGPESHRLLLSTGPARLIAFRHEAVPATAAMPVWRAEEHEVERWCRLLSESGIAADRSELAIRRPAFAPPAWARGATLIHPGAAAAARRWPARRWAEIAAAERSAGREVLLSGSSCEAELARRIAATAGLPSRSVLAGRTDLIVLAAHVAQAGVVICGDTGVGHLATALGVPSVLVFGPTPPARWGPPPERRRHRVLWRGRAGDPHADVVDPGLAQIGSAAVLAELRALRGDAVPR
jgi:ADP-heptose:LPS heptosyltransferase